MKKIILLFIFLIHSAMVFSQGLDTNYVVSYKNRLAVSLFQSYRYFELYTTQNLISDTAGLSPVNYIARGNNGSGISFDYDKVSIALGWKTQNTENDTSRKGSTSTRNLAVSFNLKKTRIETYYRRYQGFYDSHTNKYGPDFSDSVPYYQNRELINQVFRIKAIHFFNKKNRFSYGAAYSNNQRQLKTAGTFILVGNLYNLKMNSSQSFITPHVPDTFYGEWNDWNYMNVTGLSVCPGYSLNLVLFKRLFGNLTIAWGLELQRREFRSIDNNPSVTDWNLNMTSGDARFSLGYNGKNFYLYSFFIGDYTTFLRKEFRMDNKLIAGGLTFGYRFRFDNRFTTWLKGNRIYRKL